MNGAPYKTREGLPVYLANQSTDVRRLIWLKDICYEKIQQTKKI